MWRKSNKKVKPLQFEEKTPTGKNMDNALIFYSAFLLIHFYNFSFLIEKRPVYHLGRKQAPHGDVDVSEKAKGMLKVNPYKCLYVQ